MRSWILCRWSAVVVSEETGDGGGAVLFEWFLEDYAEEGLDIRGWDGVGIRTIQI
jgi:hypothetical protein